MKESPNPNVEGYVNRRSFLKTTSTAAAGGALLATLPVERFALGGAISPGDTIRVALIGCGGRGNGAAAQALKACKQAKLITACDAFKDKIEGGIKEISGAVKDDQRVAVNDDHQFVGPEAYKQAIATADVVILATPPGLRPIMFE